MSNGLNVEQVDLCVKKVLEEYNKSMHTITTMGLQNTFQARTVLLLLLLLETLHDFHAHSLPRTVCQSGVSQDVGFTTFKLRNQGRYDLLIQDFISDKAFSFLQALADRHPPHSRAIAI